MYQQYFLSFFHSLKSQIFDILPATKPRSGCFVVNGSLFCPSVRKLSLTLPYFPSLFTPVAINNPVVRRPFKRIHFILSVVSNFLFIVSHSSRRISQGSTFLQSDGFFVFSTQIFFLLNIFLKSSFRYILWAPRGWNSWNFETRVTVPRRISGEVT